MKYLASVKTKDKFVLDNKDKQILQLLSENARMSNNVIAKNVRLSKDTVRYRINNYIKKGIIQGYKTIVDINKFGFDAYHLFLRLNKPTEEAEKKLIDKLVKYPFVRALIKFNGSYDFELAIIARNIKEFDSILGNILNECSEYLQDYETLVITKVLETTTGLPRGFLESDKSNIIETKKTRSENIVIDNKDKQILKEISEKANMPLYQVAEKVDLSADAVNYRIKKLIRGGVIKRFVPAMNYDALSYNMYTILLFMPTLTPQKELKLKEFLNKEKNILWAAKTVGKYNVILYVLTKSVNELHEAINNIRNEFANDLKNYETLIAYEEYKYLYFPENI